jgi:stage V sporulation protein B
MSVYGLAVTAASAGVNLAATRLCAEAVGTGSAARLRAALRRCLGWALLCGCSACLLLFSGAEWVAGSWLGDVRCTSSLRLLALSLPFIAASNVLHGYFTAVRRVSRSAASQIFEQTFKMLVCIGAFTRIMPGDIEGACIALVGGGALAELASFLFALVLYLIDRTHAGKLCETCRIDGKSLTREMLSIILPVAAAAFARSGLSTLEHMLIPRGLRANPATAETALASYGVLCGMAMPVVLFPTALLYSFTGLLVPEFAEADARGERGRIRGMVSRALGMTLIFAIGCAGILSQFADELGMLIYKSADAGQFIRVMAPLVPVMYFDHAVDAMLKGLGEQVYSMKVKYS